MFGSYYNLKERIHLISSDIYSKWRSPEFIETFSKVNCFCLFIGYPRSGHSLIGSLLDAHHNVIVANELDVLKYFEYGLERDQIFYLLLCNSKSYARKGRTQTNYNYNVPGQWQGRFNGLKVIGDKKGGMTSQRIGQNFDLLNLINKNVKVPVKYLHVVRNPFDNITTMTLRTKSTLEKEIKHYFNLCAINQKIKDHVGENCFEIAHEHLIENKDITLVHLLDYFDISYNSEYIRACKNVISDEPSKTRYKLKWNKELIDNVYSNLEQFEFLKKYTFED